MKPEKKQFRCAIYTRKSTDHNLDIEFNSLDAQREACAAYIKSQASEGWLPTKGDYDDGAFSGATLDRPALQELLAAIREKKIDIIVVYKVDRLTRSLADFAKLVELFDQHGVSFVSVTQSFNTTTSMGRLTLNVLLSFAQFEREVTSERIRDKVAASKRKGIWVGGPIPAGYKSIDKKLVIDEPEAAKVRMIFQRYAELKSIGSLQKELDKKKIITRVQTLSGGRERGGCRMGRGLLAHMLKNRFYIGEVVYKGETNKGDHPAIIDRVLFEKVQSSLSSNRVERKLKRGNSQSLLTGLLYDDRGNLMSPSHSRKQGARYRYYVSQALLQSRNAEAGSVPRVSADQIESAVLASLRKENIEVSCSPTSKEISSLISRAELKKDRIGVRLTEAGQTQTKSTIENLTIAWNRTLLRCAKGVLHRPDGTVSLSAEHLALLKAVASARCWIEELESGSATSFAEIAGRENRCERHIRLLAPLAFISPRLLEAAERGDSIGESGVTTLAVKLAHDWQAQETTSRASF